MTEIEYKKRAEASEIEPAVNDARELAQKLGLAPYDVKYWVVDHDEMNKLIAYGGFQHRYPHWRWGMQYDHQRKQGRLGMGKAFEIVNNDDPSNAFLQVSNSLADQKAVITHVEAHADFFANNEWFQLFNNGDIDAVSMLSRHADIIEDHIDDPSIDRDDVESFIDDVLCIEDTIDQTQPFPTSVDGSDGSTPSVEENIDALGFEESIESHIFDDEWIEEQRDDDDNTEVTSDLLAFILAHGMEYDESSEKAVEMADWKKDIIRILRTEAYYFAPQKMTKVMNEGWAAYYESLMMSDETFAESDEFITYADHMSKVLQAGGLNPYSLGMQLWEYAENQANRREVIDKLLRVDGVTPRNFFDVVDIDGVLDTLEPDDCVDVITRETIDSIAETHASDSRFDAGAVDKAVAGDIDVGAHPWKVLTYEGLAERHYSLVRRQNRSFLADISHEQLEEEARYILDDALYDSVDEALADVEYTVGWDLMREIRESHNDVTFIDEFLTKEFVNRNNFFAYEYSYDTELHHVSSTEYRDVKQKILLQFTNFGKPTIEAYDDNFNNKGELLLGHKYNGIMLDIEQAMDVLERIYNLWGRPVHLMTVVKDVQEDINDVLEEKVVMGMVDAEVFEKNVVEIAQRIVYDGDEFSFEQLDPELEEQILADEVNYDTRPEDWDI